MASVSTKVLSFTDQLKVSREEASFRELRTRGGLYVDKTKHVYDLLKNAKYFFIARPRRFGKSLLCSTLEELFSGNREMFNGLWIEQSDWEWTKHPVIKLDMSGVAGRGATKALVEQSLRFRLKRIAIQYEIVFDEVLTTRDLLVAMIQQLKEKFNRNVVVIIDEYDKPMLDVIDDPVAFEDILGFFKSFYEQLKAETAHLKFVFVTGVFKFSKVGMFSGANNFTDITFDPSAGTLLGYTQEELEKYFDEGIKNLGTKLGKDRTETLQILREKYNGYRFGFETATSILSEGVYNSFGINHVFANCDLVEKWFESGSPSVLLKKLHKQSCQALLNNELSINPSQLSSSKAKEEIEPLPLLYFAGYLTIESYKSRLLKLRFPNGEVGTAFFEQLIFELEPSAASAILRLSIIVVEALSNQSFDNLQNLFNQALANAGYKLMLSREDQYQLFFVMLLHAGGSLPRVEEVTQDGRIDIIIPMRHVIYIMELKINQAPKKAIEQIKEKDYARKYRHLDLPIWAVGIKLAGEAKRAKKAAAGKGAKTKAKKPKNEVLGLVVERL